MKKKWGWAVALICVVAAVGIGICALAAGGGKDPWGLELSAYDVTAEGCTLAFDQRKIGFKGELDCGAPFWLERKEGDSWTELTPVIEDYGWSSKGMSIPRNIMMTTEVEWDWLYGPLPAGEYRLAKKVYCWTGAQGSGQSEGKVYYAEFTL